MIEEQEKYSEDKNKEKLYNDISQGFYITDQKQLYDDAVYDYFKHLVNIFHEEINDEYGQQLMKAINTNEKGGNKNEILRGFIRRYLSVFDLIFKNLPVSEENPYRIPEREELYTNYAIFDYIFFNKGKEFCKDEILLLRKFFDIHIRKKISIDYRVVPIDLYSSGNKIEYPGNIKKYTDWLVNGALIKFYEWINEQNKQIKRTKQKAKPPETIIEIWKPDNNGSMTEYQRNIEKLKIYIEKIDGAFLSEKDGKLYWNRKIRGSILYLAAWLHICIRNGWLKDTLSAPQYRSILNNTFHAEIGSTTPFKRIDINRPAEKYCDPFNNIPINLTLKD